jgi:hypothetical protein
MALGGSSPLVRIGAGTIFAPRGSSSIGRVPVSKTGGSRFESWLPRLGPGSVDLVRPWCEHLFVYQVHVRADFDRVKLLVRRGLSDYEIAKRLELPRSTVQNWRRRDDPPFSTGVISHGWQPADNTAYAYLFGIYLGDGHVVAGRLDLYLDAAYQDVIAEVENSVLAAFPSASVRRQRRPGAVRLVATGVDWARAFPQHGPGKKHQRPIELELWQREITTSNPQPFLRGLIHSDGCRCVNEFETNLPSGRVASYAYPRYFFTNLSTDIRELFAEHCDQLGIRWTQSSPRNLSVSHRRSVAALDAFIGPKT